MNRTHQQAIQVVRAAGLSQARIAKKVGCSQATISDLETGKQTDTSFSIGQKLHALADNCEKSSVVKRKKAA